MNSAILSFREVNFLTCCWRGGRRRRVYLRRRIKPGAEKSPKDDAIMVELWPAAWPIRRNGTWMVFRQSPAPQWTDAN